MPRTKTTFNRFRLFLRPHFCRFCGRLYGDFNKYRTHFRRHKNMCHIRSTNKKDKFRNLKSTRVCKTDYTNKNASRLSYNDNLNYPDVTLINNNILHLAHQSHLGRKDIDTKGKKLRQHQCEYCARYFSRKKNKLNHVRIFHTKEKPFKCRHCDNVYPSTDYRNVHERKQHLVDTRPVPRQVPEYRCLFCNKLFKARHKLIQHERIHTKEKPYKCSFCSKGFTSASRLTEHENIHTNRKPYLCKYCGKGFAQSSSRSTHQKTHFNHKPYLCVYCGKHFLTKEAIKRHERTHTDEKPYRCNYCDNRFSDRSSKRTHEEIHSEQKPYLCQFCNTNFRRKPHLDSHVRRIHKKEKPHQCCVCLKFFSTRGEVTVHQRSVHTKEKPYSCKHCNKAFSTSGNRNQHEKTHDKVKGS